MDTQTFLLLAFLIVLWWVSIWGLIDIFLQPLIKGSTTKAVAVYGVIFVTVAAVLASRPDWIEHFV